VPRRAPYPSFHLKSKPSKPLFVAFQRGRVGSRSSQRYNGVVKRAVRRAAYAVSFLLLVAVFLHISFTKNLIRYFLSKNAQVLWGVEVSAGALDYRLWRGEVVLEDLHFAAGPDRSFTFRAERLEARLDSLFRVTVRIARPRLRLQQSEGQAAGPLIVVPSVIGTVDLSDGGVEVIDSAGKPWLGLEEIALTLREGASGHQGRLLAGRGRLTAATEELPLSAVEARFAIGEGRLQISDARAQSGSSLARVKGSITRLSPFTAALSFDFEADAALARKWNPRLRAAGRLTGRGSLETRPGELGIKIDFQSDALSWGRLSAFSARGKLELAKNRIVLSSLEVAGYEGRVLASGLLELGAKAKQELHLKWSGLDLGALLRDTIGSPVPLASRLAGEADLRLTEWDAAHAEGTARLALSPADDTTGARLDGTVSLEATGGTLSFQSEDLTFQEGTLAVAGTVHPESGWAARYRLQARDLGALGLAIPLDGVPEDLSGSLDAEGRLSGPLARPIWTAVFSAHALHLWGQEIRVATGGLRAAEGRIQLEEVKLLAEGGALTANGSFPIAEEAGDWQVEAKLHRFPFNAAPLRAPFIPLMGAAGGRLRISGPARDPDLEGSLELALPQGEASLELRKEGSRLVLERLQAAWGAGSLDASGQYDLLSRRVRGRFRGSDLRLSALPGWAERFPTFSGRLSFSGEVEGAPESPEGRASVTLQEASFRGARLPDLRAEAFSDGRELRMEAFLPDMRLLTARCALAAPYPIEAAVDLAAVPTEALLSSFPQLEQAAPALEMAGEVEIQFPAFEPRNLRYVARVEKLLGRYRDIGGGAGAPFLVEGDLSSLHLRDLELVGTQTAIAVSGTVPLAAESGFDLNLRGALRLELARALFPQMEAAGEANIDLTLKGTRADPKIPEIIGDAHIREASLGWRGLRLTGITAELDSDEDALSLKSLRGSVLGGRVELEGSLPWPHPAPGRPARASLRLSDLDLGELVPPGTVEEAGRPRPTVQATVVATLEADSLQPEALRGEGSIEQLRAQWGEATLSSKGPARFRIGRGQIELPLADLTGGETELQLGVKARLTGEQTNWEASLRGVLDATLLNPFVSPMDIVLSGKTRLDFLQRSSPDGPLFSGSGSLDSVQLILRDPPLTLSDIRGQIRFQDRALVLSDLTAETGGGHMTGAGRIDLAGLARIERVDFQTEVEAVRLNYPEGLRSESSGSFHFRGSPDRFVLSGEVRLIQGLYNRNISIQTELLRSAGHEAARLMPQDSFQEKVELDLRLRTENDLRIDNSLAQVEAAATVRLSGSLASPQMSGVLTARPGGSFRLGRNRFRLESGRVDLNDYPLGPPEMQLRARTVVSDVDILVDIRGTPEELRTEISAPSHPELTRADLASLLVTGRTLERVDTEGSPALGELTGGEILGEQLVNLFSGALADLATQGLGQALPFDQVSIEPTLVAREADPGARFTLGKALTPELFVTYSVGLSDTEQQIWIVDYRLARNLVMRGVREDDNSLTGGFSQRLPFDLYSRSRRLTSEGVPRPRVTAVEVAGEMAVGRTELERTVKLGAGDRYDYWKAQEDAERIRKALRERGFIGAVVDVETREVDEHHVALTFGVKSGDRLQIVWEGEDPGRSVKRKIENAWDGRLPEKLLLSELAAATARELKRKGHYLARVSVATEGGPEGRRVIFQVARGPRGSRVRVDFLGNAQLDDGELSSVLPKPSTALFFELVEGRPFRLRELLRLQYAARGFLDARVGVPQIEYQPDSGELRVAIQIEEGSPAHLGEIAFQGLSALTESEARKELRLREGEPFLLPDYLRDRAALRALYRRRGFVDATVRGRIERPEGAVRVAFQVEEGERAMVGPVRIEGNRITRESLIRRQLTFQEGEPLQAVSLTESQRQLYDLGAFRSADVRVEPEEPGVREREVVVEVSEAPDLDFNYGVRYNTEDRFEVLAEARFPNLFGRALQFGLTGLINPDQSILRANFHTPFFYGYKLDTGVYLGREAEEDENAISRTARFTFQQSRELARKLRLQWSYSFRRIYTLGKVTESSPFPFEFTTDRASLIASLIEDRRDSVISPRRGRFWSVSFEYAPELLGSDIKFQKLYGQFFYYRSVWKKLVWASGYRMGLAQGFADQSLLKEDRFQAGGATTVRGFARSSLGPVEPITGTVIGGESVLIFNQEIRFPVYRWFSGVAFYDAGNVFATVSDLDLTDLRHNLGIGIRFGFSFGLLRLDWARVLDPRPGDPTWRYFFSIGHAF